LIAFARADSALGFIKRFYLTFAALAPLPSLIFARHYARFAAQVHTRCGFGECKPRIEPLSTSIRRLVHGFIMVSIAPGLLLVPVGILAAFPGTGLVGKALLAALAGIWALHWIVVDALDNAQVIIPDRPQPKAPPPWFVLATRRVRVVSRFLDRYSKFWREE